MRSKLVLSIIALVLLMATTITGTWAYINYNETFVSNLSIEALTYGYTKVSIDGQNYSESLSLDEIKKAIAMKINESADADEVYSQISLKPLTSLNGISMSYVEADGLVTPVSIDSKSYIQFDLYFKSTYDKAFDLYFNTDEVNTDLHDRLFSIDSGRKTIDGSFTSYDENGNQLNHNGDDEVYVSAKDAIRFSTMVDNQVKIYEPNLGLGSYATDLNSSVYSNYKYLAASFDYSKNASYTYLINQGISMGYLDYDSLPYVYRGFEELDALTVASFTRKDEVKKVTFTFWLEGYDADCLDDIVNDTLSISLSFRGSEKMEAYQIDYHDGENIKSIKYVNSVLRNGNSPYLINKDGFVLEGWYEDEDCTTLYDFSKRINVANYQKDLYAKWLKI